MAGQISVHRRQIPRDYSRLGVVGIASGALIAAFVGAILWGQAHYGLTPNWGGWLLE